LVLRKNRDKKLLENGDRPLLLVDVDGVISLYGFALDARPPGQFLMVDGIAHFLSAAAGEHLRDLSDVYELTWCTGWEEKANDYLPRQLGLDGPLPYVPLKGDAVPGAHWKLAGIDSFAGSTRPLAWIDDAHDDDCVAWAARRPGPTLLVGTDPPTGIGPEHVARLRDWAGALR
jgi:hypothetical protein